MPSGTGEGFRGGTPPAQPPLKAMAKPNERVMKERRITQGEFIRMKAARVLLVSAVSITTFNPSATAMM